MPALLDEIISLALDDQASLASILRKCLVLASELKNEQLRNWANQELDGYKGATEVPAYRRYGANAYGHFVGYAWSQHPRHLIPSGVLPKELRHWAESVDVQQSVGSLDDLRKSAKGAVITFPWPPNMVALYQDKLVVGMMCHNAWQELPTSALVEILETVRNTTLRMALDIRDKLPATQADNLSSLEPEVKQTVNQVIIKKLENFGNVALGDLSLDKQTIIVAGDRKTLDTALTKSGMNQTDLAELTAAIQIDGNKAGSTVAKWIGDKAEKMLINGSKMGASIAQQVLTEMLMQHYGLRKP
jgi:hypothetical protein